MEEDWRNITTSCATCKNHHFPNNICTKCGVQICLACLQATYGFPNLYRLPDGLCVLCHQEAKEEEAKQREEDDRDAFHKPCLVCNNPQPLYRICQWCQKGYRLFCFDDCWKLPPAWGTAENIWTCPKCLPIGDDVRLKSYHTTTVEHAQRKLKEEGERNAKLSGSRMLQLPVEAISQNLPYGQDFDLSLPPNIFFVEGFQPIPTLEDLNPPVANPNSPWPSKGCYVHCPKEPSLQGDDDEPFPEEETACYYEDDDLIFKMEDLGGDEDKADEASALGPPCTRRPPAPSQTSNQESVVPCLDESQRLQTRRALCESLARQRERLKLPGGNQYPNPSDGNQERPGSPDGKKKCPGTAEGKRECPGASSGKQERPGSPDCNKKCPGSADGKQERPGASDGKQERPGSPDVNKECPHSADAKQEPPGASDGNKECPHSADAKQEPPGASGGKKGRTGSSDGNQKRPGASDGKKKCPDSSDGN